MPQQCPNCPSGLARRRWRSFGSARKFNMNWRSCAALGMASPCACSIPYVVSGRAGPWQAASCRHLQQPANFCQCCCAARPGPREVPGRRMSATGCFLLFTGLPRKTKPSSFHCRTAGSCGQGAHGLHAFVLCAASLQPAPAQLGARSDGKEQVDAVEWQVPGQSRHCYHFVETTCLCLKMHPVCMYADSNLWEDHLLHPYGSCLFRHLPRFHGRFVAPLLECRQEIILVDVLVLEMVGPTLHPSSSSTESAAKKGNSKPASTSPAQTLQLCVR